MAKVVIFGLGPIAEIAHYYLTHDSEHDVVGFCVDAQYVDKSSFQGVPVVAYEELCERYPPDAFRMFMPISYRKVNALRKEKYEDAKGKGYSFISYISSNARFYDTPVGENCFILEDNVIQPYVIIGNNCILWSGNHIGHHTIIQDHCFLASHVVVSGNVVIGERTFIGVNATIGDNVTIGKANILGAGSLILKDTGDKSVFSEKMTEASRIPSDRLRGF